MKSINRRSVLKSMTALSAATIAPFSLYAARLNKSNNHCAIYIDVVHNKINNRSSNSVTNTGNENIVLSSNTPLTYEDDHGQVVALHINSKNKSYRFAPGKKLPIYARAVKIEPITSTLANVNIPNGVLNLT